MSSKAVRDLKFEPRVETRVFENGTRETRDETRVFLTSYVMY